MDHVTKTLTIKREVVSTLKVVIPYNDLVALLCREYDLRSERITLAVGDFDGGPLMHDFEGTLETATTLVITSEVIDVSEETRPCCEPEPPAPLPGFAPPRRP